MLLGKLTGWEPVCPKLNPLLPLAPKPDGWLFVAPKAGLKTNITL